MLAVLTQKLPFISGNRSALFGPPSLLEREDTAAEERLLRRCGHYRA
jgi:hypothetical protein